MGYLLFCLFVFVVGLLIIRHLPSYFFMYWLSFKPIVLPFILYFWPISGEDDFYYYYNNIDRPFLLIFLYIIFKNYSIVKYYFRKYNYKLLFLPLVLLILYFIIRQYPSVNFYNIYYLIYIYVAVIAFISSPKFNIDHLFFNKFLIVIVLIQLLFVVLNFYGFKVYPILANSEFSEFVSGTFSRYNHLTNFLTTIFLYVSLEYFHSKSFSSWQFGFVLFTVGTIVLISGAKISLAIYFLSLLVSVLFASQSISRFLAIISFVLVSFFAISFFSSSLNSISGFSRNIEGFSRIFESSLTDNTSTLGLSFYLFSQFDHPLLGNCFEFKGEYAYYLGTCVTRNFISDARLAYIIVEYGIICLVLYVFYYYRLYCNLVFDCDRSSKIKLIIFFGYFFILNLTELGFFDPSLIPFLFVYSLLKYNDVNNINKNENSIYS